MNGSSSLSLAQLYNFKKLAEKQHMTRAAEELYITQPTLSLSVKALEHELGVALFYRSGRAIRLTKLGQEFYDEVSVVLTDLDRCIEAIRAHGETTGGTLRIGTIPTIQHDFLPALLQQIWKKYGYNVKMGFTVEFSLPLTRALKEQEYDLIFASKAESEPNIEYVPMLTKRLIAVVNKENPLAGRESLSLAELTGMPFTSYTPGTPLGNETKRLLDTFDMEPSITYDDEFTLTSVVTANSTMPGVMLDTFAIERFDGVVKIPLEDVADDFHTIYLGYDKRLYRSKVMDGFIAEAARFASSWNAAKNVA